MKFSGDVDIDMADRSALLALIKHIPAAMYDVKPPRKHTTGVHVTNVPYNPVYDMSALDYTVAEQRGYFKLDLLNVYLYSNVRSMNHLRELLEPPNWSLLKKRDVVHQLIHIGNHWSSLQRMPEPIDSIPRLAMFLAVIRPSKKHLIGLPWAEVAKTIWDKDSDGYAFKKSHSIAYAHLVVVNMNLLEQGLLHTAN